MPTVEFHFDFGSPNSYMSHQVIPAIEERQGVKFDYVPVLLGGVFKLTNNVPPLVSLKGIKNKPEYQRLEMQRFIRDHGITRFNHNPHFPVNTLQIMRGAVYAKRSGILDGYVDAVFRGMWEDQKKMDDAEVIRQALAEADLPADEIIAGTQDPEVKQELIANTDSSVSRGTFGSPSFYVGDELFFGKDKLRDAEEEIVRQKG